MKHAQGRVMRGRDRTAGLCLRTLVVVDVNDRVVSIKLKLIGPHVGRSG